MTIKKIKICIIAGETSGDLLASELIHEMKQLSNNAIEYIRSKYQDLDKKNVYQFAFYGVGGDKMRSVGCELFETYEHLDHIGIESVAMNFIKIAAKFKRIVRKIIKLEPDIIITIDSGGFNFRLVKKLKPLLRNTKFIHYVAPTVWAYSAKRVKLVQRLYDRLILLYSFEDKHFPNIRKTIAGFDTLARITNTPALGNISKTYDLSEDITSISILLGSRPAEIKRHLAVVLDAIKIVLSSAGRETSIKFFILPSSHTLIEVVKEYCRNKKVELSKLNIVFPLDISHKHHIMSASKVIWSKCGTASLEAVAYQIPILCFYKVGVITAFLLRWKLKNKKMSFVMANILLDENLIPEFIQNQFTGSALAESTTEILNNYDKKKNEASDVMRRVMNIAHLKEYDGDRNSMLFLDVTNIAARKAAIGVVEEIFVDL